ncbi:MAG: hypothetical protein H0V47_00555 [Chloroflexia bacterium]|nr:hypothetical protein [Chloroflexia bacterium]
MTAKLWRSRAVLLASAMLVLTIVVACGDPEEATDPVLNSGSVATNEPTALPANPSEGVAQATEIGGPGAAPVDLAPELLSVEAWYNSEPLTLEALRGEPVLLVFWATY